MNKRIYLVTGGAGFLGGTICRKLTERGDKVRTLVLKDDPTAKNIPGAVEVTEGDLTDVGSLEKFFTVPEGYTSVVIQVAGVVRVDEEYHQSLIDVNVGGAKNIIAMCLAHPEVEKLVYVSSTGAIPESPMGQPIREVENMEPEKVRGWYSRSKAMATQAVLDAAREQGLNACVVYPTGIMGPGDLGLTNETTNTIIRIMKGGMTVGMCGSLNLVDVRDLADGTIAAADRGGKGETYILGNEEITLREMCRMLREASGCRQPLFYVPISMAYKMAAQMEKKARKSGKKPLMTNFSVYNLARNNRFDCSKARRELGYHPRSYAETLRDEANWLVEAGYVPGTVRQLPRDSGSITEIVEDKGLLRAIAAAANREQLRARLREAGISQLDEETIAQAFTFLSVIRQSDKLLAIFRDTDYARCCERLAADGIKTSPAEYDLIQDVLSAADDSGMGTEMRAATDWESAVNVLQKRGYYHITAEFLEMLVEYALLLRELFTPEEYEAMANMPMEERCTKTIQMLCAADTVAAMRFGLPYAMEPAYLIALSCAIHFIHIRN